MSRNIFLLFSVFFFFLSFFLELLPKVEGLFGRIVLSLKNLFFFFAAAHFTTTQAEH